MGLLDVKKIFKQRRTIIITDVAKIIGAFSQLLYGARII